MDGKQAEAFKKRLLCIRQELLNEGNLEIEADQRAGGEGRVDDDMAPLTEMNQVIASSRNRERTLRMKQISEAIERVIDEPEDFGLCDVCGEDIPVKRLELMPWVTLCIRCQSKEESERSSSSRRHLADYK